MRAAGLVCLGAGAGLIRGDLRDVRGSDVACRSGGVVVYRARRPPAHGAGAGPLPRPAAGRGAVRRDRAGLRRGRSRPPEPDEPADQRAGRRERACPGWTPPGCARPGWPDCAELLGLATFMHAAGISCSQRLGDLVAGLEPAGEAARGRAARGGPPAMIPLAAARGDHRRLRRRAADRGHAADRGAPPAAERSAPCWPGMCLAQADHRPAHLTRVHQALTSLPEDDQRRLGVIADWKHGPHRLTYRQTERTFGLVTGALGKDDPDGLPSAALQAICDDLLEASDPGRVQGRQHVAGGGLDRPGILLPAPARAAARLRRPRSLLGTPQEQPAAQPGRAVLRLLPVRRDHDARGERPGRPRARPPRHGLVVPRRPGPRLRSRC